MDYNPSYNRKYPYIYRGIVVDNEDPKKLGRCKVRVPDVHGGPAIAPSALPWARPVVSTPTGKERGSVMIPSVGDIVWVMFEGAVKESPIYLGGVYSLNNLDIDPSKIILYKEGDDSISYDREERSFTIKVGDTELIINKDGTNIGGGSITVSAISDTTIDNICC